MAESTKKRYLFLPRPLHVSELVSLGTYQGGDFGDRRATGAALVRTDVCLFVCSCPFCRLLFQCAWQERPPKCTLSTAFSPTLFRGHRSEPVPATPRPLKEERLRQEIQEEWGERGIRVLWPSCPVFCSFVSLAQWCVPLFFWGTVPLKLNPSPEKDAPFWFHGNSLGM